MDEKKEEVKKFRFICTRCGNCCTDKNTLVNLTYSDILRIKNGLNLTLEELLQVIGFYVFETELTEEALKKLVIPPIATEKGLSFIGLLKKSTGACYFYNEKEKKCLIYELRPNFCKSFPFSFKILLNAIDKSKAKIIMFLTEKGKVYCPGIGVDAPLINEDEWIILGKKIIEDLNNNSILVEKWNDAVKKGEIKQSVRNFLLNIFKLKENNNNKKQ